LAGYEVIFFARSHFNLIELVAQIPRHTSDPYSFCNNRIQSLWLDLAENQEGTFDRSSSDRILLVRTWDLVWVGLLSHNSLAMAGKRKIGRNQSS